MSARKKKNPYGFSIRASHSLKICSTANISTLFESTNKMEENLLLNKNLLKNVWEIFINKVNLRNMKNTHVV